MSENETLCMTSTETDKYSELDLFKFASEVDKGNMFAREKLAYLELQNENYLEAALQFELILDFIQAEFCYGKALDCEK